MTPHAAAARELLTTRRSVRRFTREPVARDQVTQLVAMAATAPSASNQQPWRFFACDDGARIGRLAAAVQASVDRIAGHISGAMVRRFQAYGDYFVRFREAPVVLVVAYRPLAVLSRLVDPELPRADGAAIESMEQVSGLASTAMAIQNLLLYAHAMGLGASCMTGPLVAAPALQQLMGIPDSWRVAAVVAIGHPDEEPVPPERKPVEAVLRWVT